jgi:Flp pilus assembly protein TadD
MDDAVAIEKNPVVIMPQLRFEELMSRDFWGLPMHGSGWTNKSFRPLTSLTYRWNYLLHGLASSGFHITNVLLHCVASIVVGRTATLALGMSGAWAALAAMFFGVHPVHTENILYLVGRADVLAACLGLAALNVYLSMLCPAPMLGSLSSDEIASRKQSGVLWDLFGLLPTTILIVASGLCKETGFTFLLILLGVELLDALWAYDRAVASRQHNPMRIWRRVRMRLGMLISVTMIVFVMRYRHTGGTELNMSPQDNPISFESSKLVRVLSYAYIHGVYTRLLCWPQFLCYDYSMDAIPPVQMFSDCRLLLPLAAYVGFAATVTATLSAPRRYRRAGLISLAVLVVPFLPASNILFPVGTVVGERLLYIPSAGFCLALLIGLHRVVEPACGAAKEVEQDGQKGAKGRRHKPAVRERTIECSDLPPHITKAATRHGATIGAALLAIVVLFTRTLVRVGDWESSDTLFIRDGSIQPTSSKTQFNLGITHMQRQEWDEAVQALVRCAWADPLSSLPFYRIGQIEILRGRFSTAENYLSAAIEKFGASLMVRDEEVFHDLAVAMFQNGKADGAERRLRIALRINPDFAKGWNNLACCIASHDLQNAARAARKAATLAPENPQYWANLALLSRHTRDASTSATAWHHASTLWPGMPEPRDCTWEFAPAG